MARPKRFCSIDGCDEPCKGHGLCRKHYYRQYRGNDPEIDIPRGRPRKQEQQ